MTELKIQKNIGAGFNSTKSTRENLHEILEELLIKGKFDRCVLFDDKGMVFSDVGQSDFSESAVGGMFALIHNVVKRTIENLDLISLDVVKISTFKGVFLSSIFKIEHYNRSMILTAYYNEESEVETQTQTQTETETKIEINSDKISNTTKKISKPKISLLNLLKLYLKSKQRKEDNFTLLSKTLFYHNSPDEIFNLSKSKRDQNVIQTKKVDANGEKMREVLIKESVNLLKIIFEN